MECIDKARAWITSRGLIAPGDRVISAVSGGPDSMAMLTILADLAGEMRLELAAAHFDHMIRSDSVREKRLVEKYCARLQIPLFCGAGDVPAASKSSGMGIEEVARELRYAFLEDTARQWQADAVALGHHRDDQVETVLHHIIRGSGIRGLAGMPEKRGIFVRPVLCLDRGELRDLLRTRGILYAIDPSNRDNRIFRNRVRNTLLPLLRKDFNPSIDDALLRVSGNAAEGWQTLLQPVEKMIGGMRTEEAGGGKSASIGLEEVSGLPDHQIYILVDSILREHFGVVQDMTRKHFDAVKRLIRRSSSGRRVQLVHGITVHRTQSEIRFSSGWRPGTVHIGRETSIPGEGTFSLAPWPGRIVVELLSGKQARTLLKRLKGRQTDENGAGAAGRTAGRSRAGKLRPVPAKETIMAFSGFPLRVRQREAGDRLAPFGMKGSRKLSDILIDRKIDLERRDSLPIFEDSAGIVWIPGVVAAERTRVTPATGRAVHLRIEIPSPE